MLTGNPYIAVWSWIFIWFVSRTVVAAAFLVQHLQQSYCGQGCIEGWGCYYAMAENLPVLHPGDHSDCAGESRGAADCAVRLEHGDRLAAAFVLH